MTRRVATIVPDLFFAAKIAATAEAAGVTLEPLAPGAAPTRLAAGGFDQLILDLGDPSAIELARELKAHPATRHVPIVGFYSHVEQATREAALAAGIEQVLPRSAFTARLADLLRGNPAR